MLEERPVCDTMLSGGNVPRKKYSLYDPMPLERTVDIKLQQSNLNSSESQKPLYYGQVQQRRFTVGNAIAELAESRSNLLSKETVFYVVSQLNQLLLNKLAQGYAIDLLDLGTLRMTVDGSIDAGSDKSEIAQKLSLSFTPSKVCRKTIQNIKIGSVKKVEASHCIQSVEPVLPHLVKGYSESSIKSSDYPVIFTNNLARITGKALKIGEGQEQGIYLVSKGPVVERIKVSVVATNKPSQLLFVVPQVPSGTYRIVVVTDISASGNKLKSQVEISSGPLEVREGGEVSFIGFY